MGALIQSYLRVIPVPARNTRAVETGLCSSLQGLLRVSTSDGILEEGLQLNLPNIVTLMRFTLIPIYLVIFFSDLPYRIQWAFAVLLLAGITDVIDGYLARRHSQVTQLGIMLDPLADKLMMLAVFLSLLISQRISIPAAVAIFLRDLGMIIASAFFHFRGRLTVPANIMGKLTTILYYVALFLLMFELPMGTVFLWGVIIFSFITALVYLIQFQSAQRTIHVRKRIGESSFSFS